MDAKFRCGNIREKELNGAGSTEETKTMRAQWGRPKKGRKKETAQDYISPELRA